MPNIKFTLGECAVAGHSYRFDYDNGSYIISEILKNGEDISVNALETIKDSREAYTKWNTLKRPDKSKRKEK